MAAFVECRYYDEVLKVVFFKMKYIRNGRSDRTIISAYGIGEERERERPQAKSG